MIHVWDVETSEKQHSISNLGMAITSIAFSPDGTQLAAGGWDGSLWIFDALTGEVIASRPTRQLVAWTIAFNADGSRFALGSDTNDVYLYDVVDEPPFIIENRVFRAHQGPVYALAFHPDGLHLASGGADGLIYTWDMDSGEIVQSTTAETNPKTAVYGLTYSPDGSVLHCGTLRGKNEIRTYDDVTWCSTAYGDTAEPVYSLAFSPDGTYFAYGDTVVVNPQRSTTASLDTRRGWSDSYRSSRSKLTFSADGSVLLNGGTYQATYVWYMDDLANGRLIHQEGLLALSPDGSLIAGGNLLIYNTLTGEQALSLETLETPFSLETYYAGFPRDAVFSPDGRLIVTASADGLLRFWGIPTD